MQIAAKRPFWGDAAMKPRDGFGVLVDAVQHQHIDLFAIGRIKDKLTRSVRHMADMHVGVQDIRCQHVLLPSPMRHS